MDYLEIARTRQSCRNYDATRPVEPEKLEAVLHAARLAPSACNAQPYHFTVAHGDKAQLVGECVRSMGMNGFTKNATAFLVIAEDAYNRTAALGAKVKDQDYRSVDIGIVAAYITDEAHTQGLGSCILGWFEEKKLQNLLNTTSRIRLVIALGYAAPEDTLRQKKRKDLTDLVTWL
ncbi:MAG: nitroreductase [Ruminococcaceae bacterium]|nr:nitroreductase [Oscillospiraceae bacterium]